MATIRRRASGWWQAMVRRRGLPPQSKTFERKTDAEAWARQIESEIDRGSFVSTSLAERTTFTELADRFEKEFAPHHYRGPAWKHKLAHLRRFFGSFSLVTITPVLVAKYRDERLAAPDPRYTKHPSPPRLSPATVKSEIDLLSKVLDVGSKEFGISIPTGNPVTSIRKPRSSKSRDRRLTSEEWQALMLECVSSKNPWLEAAVVLAVETAMRQGELLSLEWPQVDMKRRLAMLLDPDKIKNEEPRAVPLSSAALAALERLPTVSSGRVIPLDRMTLYKAFERACQRAGILNYRWHDLRHEALSRLAERGDFSVLEMAAISGHKTLQMLKRYTHLKAEDLARKLG